MSNFENMLRDDMEAVFLSDMAEDVTYTPKVPTVGNPVRTVRAIVMRDPPAGRNFGRGAESIAPKARLTVMNKAYDPSDTIHGISSATLDTGGDSITLAVRFGETARSLRVFQPTDGQESHDAGALNLELR